MQGTLTDIEALAKNVAAQGAQLMNLRDPNHTQAAQPPEHPVSGGKSPSAWQNALWAWEEAHPDNAVGTIEVKVGGRAGGESGWLDPGDVTGKGLMEFIKIEAVKAK